MKSLKTFLIISSVLLALALASGVMVWYLYQKSHIARGGMDVKEKGATRESVSPLSTPTKEMN